MLASKLIKIHATCGYLVGWFVEECLAAEHDSHSHFEETDYLVSDEGGESSHFFVLIDGRPILRHLDNGFASSAVSDGPDRAEESHSETEDSRPLGERECEIGRCGPQPGPEDSWE